MNKHMHHQELQQKVLNFTLIYYSDNMPNHSVQLRLWLQIYPRTLWVKNRTPCYIQNNRSVINLDQYQYFDSQCSLIFESYITNDVAMLQFIFTY